jgi:3-dehydroquinate dehydratase-2
MKILIMQGPNLNRLGQRRPDKYGHTTLAEIEAMIKDHAAKLGVEVEQVQSNHEGALIDWLQAHQEASAGIIFNPAGLTTQGHAIYDAISDADVPTAIVHLAAREKYERGARPDLFVSIADLYIAGMGYRGYLMALSEIEGGLKKVTP